ncbi:hypothetical protein EV421DRAFT_1738594 [Armillaria borealis]|uniref:Uncharacterized protein n=1 Tax=Armillaria borealis TaxID=47425 RepID=A0AA39JAA4_9AGAR|nr:hypothetical protein EV421DRAFT_1738594 [Armillaria borealis]
MYPHTPQDGPQPPTCRNRFATPRDLSPDESTQEDARSSLPPPPLPPRPSSLRVGRSLETQRLAPAAAQMLAQPPPRNTAKYSDSSYKLPPPPHPTNTYTNRSQDQVPIARPRLPRHGDPFPSRAYVPPHLRHQQIPMGQFPPDDSSSDISSLDGLTELFEQRDRNDQVALAREREQPLSDSSTAVEVPITDLPAPRSNNDPLNEFGGDYDWPILADIDRELLGPQHSAAWEIRWRDVVLRSPNNNPPPRPTMEEYLARQRDNCVPRLKDTTDTLEARAFANRERTLYPPAAGH